MGTPIRVLLVEDSEDDALLVLRELKGGGFDVASERVDTPEAMTAALEGGKWDAIVCDYSMPRFNAMDALRLLRGTRLDLPFLMVSGTVGEDVAVDAMRLGANDYIMKDSLARLAPALKRELQEAEDRRERRTAERALREREAGLAAIYEHFPAAVILVDEERRVLQANALSASFSQRTQEEMLGLRGGEAMRCLHSLDDPRGCGFGEYCQTCQVRNTVLDSFRTREAHLNVEATLPFQRGDEAVDTHLLVSTVPLTLDGKHRVLVALQDVTEHWRAREGLKKGQDRWQTTFDAMSDWVALVGLDGRILQSNNAVERVLGVPRDGIAGRHCCELAHGKKEHVPDCPLVAMKTSHRRETREFEIEETGRWLTVTVDPVTDENGELVGAVHVLRDITEHRREEQKRRETEERYRDLVENTSDLVQSVAPDGSLIFVNDAWRRTLGYDEEELRGLSMFDVIHPDSLEHCKEVFGRVMAGERVTHIETQFVTKDGRTVWVEGNASCRMVGGKPVATQGVFRDITERKRAEDELRESEQKYRALVENTRDVAYSTDAEGRFTYLGPQAARYGVDPEEAVSRDLLDFIAPEDRERIAHEVERTITTGAEFPTEFRVVDADGRVHWFEDQGRALRSASGEVIGISGALRDITERKRAAEALRLSARQWRSTFDAMNDAVFLLDREQHVVRCNTAAEAFCGKPLGDVVGRCCYQVIHGTSEPFEDCPHVRMLRSGRRESLELAVGDRSYDVTVDPIRDENRALVGSVHIVTDITERKQAEEALREGEAKYRTLVENLPQKVFLKDAHLAYVSCNENYARDLGIRPEDISGKTDLDFYPKELAEKYRADDRRIMAAGVMEELEEKYIQAGKEFWVHTVKTPIGGAEGDVTGILGIFWDITEHKRAEEELSTSEARLRSVIESKMIGILFWDAAGNMTGANDAFLEMVGYGRDEVLSGAVRWRDMTPPEYKDQDDRALAEVAATGVMTPIEKEYIRKDGSRMPIVLGAASLPGPELNGVAFVLDITERKQAEESLRERLKELDCLYRASHLMAEPGKSMPDVARGVVSLIPPAWQYPDVTCARITFEGEETKSANFSRTPWRQSAEIAVLGETVGSVEVCYLEERPEANEGPFLKEERVLIDALAREIGTLGERKRAESEKVGAEQALRASEERWRSLVKNAPNTIIIADRDGTIQFVNRLVPGTTEEGTIGRSVYAFIPAEYHDVARETIERVFETGGTGRYETMGPGPRGATGWYVTQVGPIMRGAQIVAVSLIATDITERKLAEEERSRLEEQFRQSQKMEAVGRLAGGIAHDFNNMLGAIIGYSDVILHGLKEGDPLNDDIGHIKTAADRAAGLTRQLLAFSRRQVLEPKVLDLNRTVTDMDKMLRRLIGEDIELKSALQPDLGRVKADPGQIEQVIMNLAVNSRDAMPDGGKLTIETADVDLDEEYARTHVGVVPGPYVMLAVSDDGCGMDAELLERVFEPFFTTKGIGKGTGLGLSTVYGIVKQSGGSIWCYSEPEKGTTFKVYLPRVGEAAEAAPAARGLTRSPRGSETVLVAEDEEVLRRLVVRMLELGGYKVLAAANGGEALLLCQKHVGTIDLLISDVVMPQMSGRELAERLAGLRPDTKVLYTSGYTDDAIVRQGVLEEGTPFIQKPFTASALMAKVREVLDAPGRGDGREGGPE